MKRLARFDNSQDHLHGETHRVIQRERSRLKRHESDHSVAIERWKKAVSSVLHSSRSRKHFQDRIHITSKEHMAVVDCFDGAKQRAGEPQDASNIMGGPSEEDLLVVHPVVDGRLKDEAQG